MKELEINKVFCESLLFANESNLWGPGDIVFEKSSKSKNSKQTNRGEGDSRPM